MTKGSVIKYLSIIGLHVALGFLIYYVRFFSLAYGLIVLFLGLLYIVKNQDKNNEALYFAAYFMSMEVFLRMTGGAPFHEIGKYAVIVFMSLGLLFKGVNKQGSYYFMLPSDSEGFPKVIAEAANFGCIPMVSEVSSIGQYVNSENGYLITPCTSEKIHELLIQISKTPENEFINKASEIYKIANSFTFAHYRNRILKEILN